MITTYTPAAKWHCRKCGELFVEPGWTLERGQKPSDNGHFYRIAICPSCESPDIETAYDYRLRELGRTPLNKKQ